jgi:hypothetical protein
MLQHAQDCPKLQRAATRLLCLHAVTLPADTSTVAAILIPIGSSKKSNMLIGSQICRLTVKHADQVLCTNKKLAHGAYSRTDSTAGNVKE